MERKWGKLSSALGLPLITQTFLGKARQLQEKACLPKSAPGPLNSLLEFLMLKRKIAKC